VQQQVHNHLHHGEADFIELNDLINPVLAAYHDEGNKNLFDDDDSDNGDDSAITLTINILAPLVDMSEYVNANVHPPLLDLDGPTLNEVQNLIAEQDLIPQVAKPPPDALDAQNV
jgi:hypothetical protein